MLVKWKRSVILYCRKTRVNTIHFSILSIALENGFHVRIATAAGALVTLAATAIAALIVVKSLKFFKEVDK